MNSTTKTILIAAAIYFLYKKGVFNKLLKVPTPVLPPAPQDDQFLEISENDCNSKLKNCYHV